MCGLFFFLARVLEDEWGWPAMLGLKCVIPLHKVCLNSTDTRLELVNGFRTYTEKISPSSLLCLLGWHTGQWIEVAVAGFAAFRVPVTARSGLICMVTVRGLLACFATPLRFWGLSLVHD
jgi:hypothetical protein